MNLPPAVVTLLHRAQSVLTSRTPHHSSNPASAAVTETPASGQAEQTPEQMLRKRVEQGPLQYPFTLHLAPPPAYHPADLEYDPEELYGEALFTLRPSDGPTYHALVAAQSARPEPLNTLFLEQVKAVIQEKQLPVELKGGSLRHTEDDRGPLLTGRAHLRPQSRPAPTSVET